MKSTLLFFVFSVLFPSVSFAADTCTVKFAADVMTVVAPFEQGRCRSGDALVIQFTILDDVISAREQFCAAGSYAFREIIRQKSNYDGNIFEVTCKYI